MKKLILAAILIVGCSSAHSTMTSKSVDNSQKYCNSWCHHLSSDTKASNNCIQQCKLQYSDCQVQ